MKPPELYQGLIPAGWMTGKSKRGDLFIFITASVFVLTIFRNFSPVFSIDEFGLPQTIHFAARR